jgi:hypothetical protein
MSDARAVRTRAAAEAVLDALESAGDDQVIAMTALGAVVGCIAASAPDPQAALADIVRIATAVVSGELVDPPT